MVFSQKCCFVKLVNANYWSVCVCVCVPPNSKEAIIISFKKRKQPLVINHIASMWQEWFIKAKVTSRLAHEFMNIRGFNVSECMRVCICKTT